MKIKMLAGFEGPTISVAPGAVTDAFSKSDALSLIEHGYAVPVVEEKVERTVKTPPPETRA
ncbi:MAG: hypothetical protein EON91_02675 [Brevundimonas sp.]|uniref:hypothetical protein n=1 Tax=Brevundimonas sp. TaxID=1871086 RepID=UPI001225EE5D|nr:hypothetical protein [Brevundimonas sp.]RZJ19118.1 MAG: hypothetical protein EON91_02675 [Brevundimonas sp.]